MRLRFTLGDIVLIDIALLEVDTDDEPEAVHDLSTAHDIGFTAPPGWLEPVEPATDD